MSNSKIQNPKSKIQNRNGGFTLVEVVVAIAIFAIVLVTVGASFRAVNNATRRTQMMSDTYQTARIALAEITRSIHNFYPYLAMLPQATTETTSPTSATASSLDETEEEEQAFIGVDETDTSTGWNVDRLSFVAVSSEDVSLSPQRSNVQTFKRSNVQTRSRLSTSKTAEQELPRSDLMAVTYYVEANPKSSMQGLVRVINRLPGLASEDEQSDVTLLSEKVRSLNVRYFDPFLSEWVDGWEEPTYYPTAVMVTVGVEREDRPGELLYLSSVTSLPMGGEAPENILEALDEAAEQQGTTAEGQMPPDQTGGGTTTRGGTTTGGGGGTSQRPPSGGTSGRSSTGGGRP